MDQSKRSLRAEFNNIVRLVSRLCGLATNFDLVIGSGAKYSIKIQHRQKGCSTIHFISEPVKEQLRFGKEKKKEFFNMIFFMLSKMPLSGNKATTVLFRIDSNVLLENLPLEPSFQSLLEVSAPYMKQKTCQNFLIFGVENDQVVKYFDPKTK